VALRELRLDRTRGKLFSSRTDLVKVVVVLVVGLKLFIQQICSCVTFQLGHLRRLALKSTN